MNKAERISDLLEWLLGKLGITSLWYRYCNPGEHPFGFTYPNSNQYESAHNATDGKRYVGIIIPDARIDETIQISGEWNFDGIYLTQLKLDKLVGRGKGHVLEAEHCIFALLHEIGHYIHFLNLPSEKEYIAFRKERLEKREALDMRGVYKSAVRDSMSMKQRLDLEKEYLSLPGEREADLFATSMFCKIWNEYNNDFRESKTGENP